MARQYIDPDRGRYSSDEECRALHEANCAAREREAMAQKEVEHLRDLVKERQNVADEAKANAVK